MSDHDSNFGADALPLPPSGDGGFFEAAGMPADSGASLHSTPYRVLARKYRPTTLDDLIGQESTVRILRRAFLLGRVAHAFMLTGVRGVGKTTTARIIARALNCTGVDGQGGATSDPCGVCPNCAAILSDRHPDVLEMDAASRTGVDDIREIIEQTRFRPIQGRMKVFIIDEVHMLSRNAFNALLKTLEEPPESVTFVFATTELRKVPVTVLSRCQRFDLRRVAAEQLVTHFETIASREGVSFSNEALRLLARASDGSVRDGLSLLDQAIARGAEEGEDHVTESVVSAMLGLSDREVIYDLLQAVIDGDASHALTLTDQAYALGVDLGSVLADLLDLLHFISRLKSVPKLMSHADLTEVERVRGGDFASRVSMAALGRAWQILVNGFKELEISPDRRAAAEMIILRLCYASDLPTPDELISLARDAGLRSGPNQSEVASSSEASPSQSASQDLKQEPEKALRPRRPDLYLVTERDARPEDTPTTCDIEEGTHVSGKKAQDAPSPELVAVDDTMPPPIRSWREAVAFVSWASQPLLHGLLRHAAHCVKFSPPEIVVRLQAGIDPRHLHRFQKVLEAYYPNQFTVVSSREEGEPTLDEMGAQVVAASRQEMSDHPLICAITAQFPGATLGIPRDLSLDDYGLPPENLDDSDKAVFDEQPEYVPPGSDDLTHDAESSPRTYRYN